MNIAYVEYDFPAHLGQGPWSAAEGKDGMLWIPYYGRGNEVARLDPKTGELTHFPLPFAKKAGIHSAVPAPHRPVRVTEASLGRVGRLDPSNKGTTANPNPARPAGRHGLA